MYLKHCRYICIVNTVDHICDILNTVDHICDILNTVDICDILNTVDHICDILNTVDHICDILNTAFKYQPKGTHKRVTLGHCILEALN